MSRRVDLGLVKGEDFKILGQYDTLEALQAAHPNPKISESYDVGTTKPYDVYTWTYIDALSDFGWLNQGPLQGPPGRQGEPGRDGVVITLDSLYYFRYDDTDGHLYVGVADDALQPPLHIDGNGHLIYTIS